MDDDRDRRASRFSLPLALVAVLALVCGMTIARVHTTLGDRNFDAREAAGLLKSDPGLLYYLVERVVDSGGGAPDDWRADPRIEHPGTYDVPAHLPVGQEFVVAWLRLALGDALPLHVFCLWISSAFASLVLLGVWLLSFELSYQSPSRAWLATLAAVLALLLPATWRTTGFVLMDEDFSLPFYALHLGLLARACRVRSTTAIVLAAVTLALAVATWHATSFLFALEALALSLVCLWTGTNPMRARGAWLLPAVLIACGLSVPFLRTTGFVTSAPMCVLLALVAAAIAERSIATRFGTRTLMAISGIACAALAYAWSRGTGSATEYGHVFDLLAAKVIHLGVLPDDPGALTAEVRLMWQGPFATLDLASAWSLLGAALLLVPLAAWAAWRGLRASRADAASSGIAVFACLACAAAWLVTRVVVLPAIVLPALAAPLLQQVLDGRALGGRALGRLLLVLLVSVQALLFWSWIARYSNPWYASPPQRQAEIAALVRAIPALVPEDAAIAADSMNATAILAHTRRRAILSPKWESSASRARVVEFLDAFYSKSPAAFRALLTTRYQCRFLLVDRFTLGYLSRYAAGGTNADPRPGTAASVFLSRDAAVLESVPGYELLYRSPAGIRQSDGTPTDFFRLYALSP